MNSSSVFKLLLILGIIISTSLTLSAQNMQGQGRKFDPSMMQAAGKIYGSVADGKSSEAIEYANIVVFKWRDSTVAYGTVTNVKGKIEIGLMMPG